MPPQIDEQAEVGAEAPAGPMAEQQVNGRGGAQVQSRPGEIGGEQADAEPGRDSQAQQAGIAHQTSGQERAEPDADGENAEQQGYDMSIRMQHVAR